MKKFLLPLLVLASLFSNAQTYTQQKLGGDKTLGTIGAISAKDGIRPGRWADTTAANSSPIKNIHGAFIFTVNPFKTWLRDTINNRWQEYSFSFAAGNGLELVGNTIQITDTSEFSVTNLNRLMWLKIQGAFRVGGTGGPVWNIANIGNYSFGSGYNTLANGNGATAMGNSTVSSGISSMAVNNATTATGDYSMAMNYATFATGNSSTAMGRNTKAKAYGSTVVGLFNDSTNAASATTANSLNRIFQIGNGTADNARSNAMTVLQSGFTGFGTTTPTNILHLNGASPLRIQTGSEGNGKVWTSDANGVGSWETPSAGSGNTNSNVGSAFRLAIPNTNNIKTLAQGYGVLHDSSTSNQISTRIDSAEVYGKARQFATTIANAVIDSIYTGSFSESATATTTFTVTIGATMADNTYKVNATPTSSLSAALFYITNKTTTTFDVVYLSGLTGTVTFDWSLFP